MQPRPTEDMIEILDQAQCSALLTREPVGRVGYVTDDGRPMILPVDFLIVDNHVIFRTDPGDKLSNMPLSRVCFEADGTEAAGVVWSVVIQGTARDITTALDDKSVHLRNVALPSFARLADPHWVAIEIEQVSGRRLRR